eukprot:sb/3464226/
MVTMFIVRYAEDSLAVIRRRRKRGTTTSLLSLIKQKLGEKTFNEFLSIDPDTSLTFVLDVTGSMDTEMDQVKVIVRELFKTTTSSPFSRYSLVPFRRDWGTRILRFGSNRGWFLSALESLRATGGGDCEEIVVRAVHEAVTEADEHTPIFVFTDAATKHQDEMSGLISHAQWMKNPVYFFLTPAEDPCTERDVQAFHRIAQQTGGQVLLLDNEENLGRLSNLVHSEGEGRALIESGTFEGDGRVRESRSADNRTRSVLFPCDESVALLLVTVNSELPGIDVQLTSPAVHDDVISPSISLAHVTVFEVKSPVGGLWELIIPIGGYVTYKVEAVGENNVDFSVFYIENGIPVDSLTPVGFFEVVTPFCRATSMRVTAPTCSHFSAKTRIPNKPLTRRNPSIGRWTVDKSSNEFMFTMDPQGLDCRPSWPIWFSAVKGERKVFEVWCGVGRLREGSEVRLLVTVTGSDPSSSFKVTYLHTMAVVIRL